MSYSNNYWVLNIVHFLIFHWVLNISIFLSFIEYRSCNEHSIYSYYYSISFRNVSILSTKWQDKMYAKLSTQYSIRKEWYWVYMLTYTVYYILYTIYSIYVQKYASIEYSMKVKKFITWVLNGFSDVLMYSSDKRKIYLLSFQSNKTFTKLSAQWSLGIWGYCVLNEVSEISVIGYSWEILHSLDGKGFKILSTQFQLRVWTWRALNGTMANINWLGTQFRLRVWTCWVLDLEYSISSRFLWAIDY